MKPKNLSSLDKILTSNSHVSQYINSHKPKLKILVILLIKVQFKIRTPDTKKKKKRKQPLEQKRYGSIFN